MNVLRMALDSIREKKGRSFLTMLGIIGVMAVLVLVALVTGYNSDVTAYYEKLGVNKVTVHLTWYDSSRAPDMLSQIYDYANDSLSDLTEGVTPDLSTKLPLQYNGTTVDSATIYFGSDQFSACCNYTLDEGRDILTQDIENRSRVCVLGSYVADALFQYSDPIGKTVTIGGYPFLVVGTYYQKDGGEESSMDNAVVIPCSASRQLLKSDRFDSIIVKVRTSNDMDTVMSKLDVWLGETVDSAVGEYELEDGNAAMTESNDEMTSLSVVLGGIASIALLVGGIGIMNIMLVTVTERTREIGIRKAIGAERKSIITQFLIEAAVICGIGGMIGIAVGYIGTMIFGKLLLDEVLMPTPFITIGAFFFSAVLGIIFGMYPAIKASGLQPVVALRAD